MVKVSLLGKDAVMVRFRYWSGYLERIRQIPGARFDRALKAWIVDRDQAERLEELFSGETVWLTPFWEVTGKPRPASVELRASYASDPIPGLMLKLPLKPHQNQAVRFCLEMLDRHGFAHIWDGVGLGKTAEAIGVAEALRSQGKLRGPALVVCPAPLKWQWAEEGVRKFTDRMVIILPPVPAQREAAYARWSEWDYVITNYELVLKDQLRLARLPVGILIADEPHEKVLNPSGKMHRAMFRSIRAPYKLFMTATPVSNDALQLFALFHLSDPSIFGSRAEFEKRYVVYSFDSGYRQLVGYRHLDELREIAARYAIRRTWQDIDLPFPELARSVRRVERTDEQREADRILDGEREAIVNELLQLAGLRTPSAHRRRLQLENRLRSLAVLAMVVADAPYLVETSGSRWARRRLGSLLHGKVSPKEELLVQTLQELLSAGEKVVVFTQFRKVAVALLKRMHRHFRGEMALLAQGVSARDREAIKQAFNEGSLQLIVATPAGRTGLNLRGGSALIHYDLPWSPSALEQREGRLTRLDSVHRVIRSVTLILDESIDEVIWRALQDKADVVQFLMGQVPVAAG